MTGLFPLFNQGFRPHQHGGAHRHQNVNDDHGNNRRDGRPGQDLFGVADVFANRRTTTGIIRSMKWCALRDEVAVKA